MAKLYPLPYPGNWIYEPDKEEINIYFARTQKMLAAIPNVVTFPRGDGQAFYHVRSFKPLVLQHIPFGDAWYIDAAYMRGLRRADIELNLRRQRFLASMFSGTEGQDRESYSDNQDRENYTVNED